MRVRMKPALGILPTEDAWQFHTSTKGGELGEVLGPHATVAGWAIVRLDDGVGFVPCHPSHWEEVAE